MFAISPVHLVRLQVYACRRSVVSVGRSGKWHAENGGVVGAEITTRLYNEPRV